MRAVNRPTREDRRRLSRPRSSSSTDRAPSRGRSSCLRPGPPDTRSADWCRRRRARHQVPPPATGSRGDRAGEGGVHQRGGFGHWPSRGGAVRPSRGAGRAGGPDPDEVGETIEQAGGSALAARCDVSGEDSVRAAPPPQGSGRLGDRDLLGERHPHLLQLRRIRQLRQQGRPGGAGQDACGRAGTGQDQGQRDLPTVLSPPRSPTTPRPTTRM